ncbi:MAG: hypothetical protein CMP51_01695 [Flavobacteriales bacterium]|nr:hypothetical protein [Flavobacteriales bacterium]|tara:strand:- start:768 stop:2219 length:1452 start_codon:yes stop_codon:yes gene_type:complete
MKNFLFTLLIAFSLNVYSQLPNGSVAPDFTLTDINGTTHHLYDYLDNGYTVFLDFSAVWCGPCWGYHTGGALEDLYVNHGPSGMPNVSSSTTNDVMVFFIEGDGSDLACLQGNGCGTQGDWVAGTPYPIICTDGSVNNTAVTSAYSIGYWPTVYQICPDRLLTECGQTATPYSLVSSCLPPPSFDNDARTFVKNSANSGCSDIVPEIFLQNYGLTNLNQVTITVSVNGVNQYTTVFDEVWNSNTNSYVPLNLSTLEIADVTLDPVYNLSNNDIIGIDVVLPNGVSDSDPTNNQTISMTVDLGFDNAYWDAPLSINVSGSNGNSWYLKQVSNNLIIASGFGGSVGSSNFFPLTFNECYTLQSVANDVNYIGASYTITDGNGQVILQGTTSQLEEFDNFSTGAEVWTNLDYSIFQNALYFDQINRNLVINDSYKSLHIYDITGRSLFFTDIVLQTVDLSSFSNGVYLVKLSNGDNFMTKKFRISN